MIETIIIVYILINVPYIVVTILTSGDKRYEYTDFNLPRNIFEFIFFPYILFCHMIGEKRNDNGK